MTGYVIFAHGSSVAAANVSVEAITKAFAARGGHTLVQSAFLELAEPTLPQAVEQLIARGAGRIVVVPYFLTPGIHLRRDLPGIVRSLSNIYTTVPIEIRESLEGHPALITALLDRAAETSDGSRSSESQTR